MKKTTFALNQKVQWRDAQGLIRVPIWEGTVVVVQPKGPGQHVFVRWDRPELGHPIGSFLMRHAQKELEVIS